MAIHRIAFVSLPDIGLTARRALYLQLPASEHEFLLDRAGGGVAGNRDWPVAHMLMHTMRHVPLDMCIYKPPCMALHLSVPIGNTSAYMFRRWLTCVSK